jgi:hypothetical protein
MDDNTTKGDDGQQTAKKTKKTERKKLVKAEINIDFDNSSIIVVFESTGKGYVKEKEWEESRENFQHDVNADLIKRAADGETVARQELIQAFWDGPNQDLDDPWIQDNYLDNVPVGVANGTLEEMEQLIRDAIMIDDGPLWQEVDKASISIITASEDEGWGLISDHRDDDADRLQKRTIEIINTLLDWFQPHGHTWEYNDGATDRQSGYSMERDSISVQTDRGTATQKAEAFERLLTWSEANRCPAIAHALGVEAERQPSDESAPTPPTTPT